MVMPSAALGSDSYVCILKCKAAEIDAVCGASRARFVPLMELTDPARASALARKWTAPDVLWVQPLNIEDYDDAAWTAAITGIFSTLRSAGVQSAPVVTLDDTPAAMAAFRAVVATDGNGAVIRVDAEELALETAPQVKVYLDDLLAQLALSPADCDLVLDASLIRDSVLARVLAVEASVRVLPYLGSWRNFVVALSAFPEQLSLVAAAGSVTRVRREDRDAYLLLVSRGIAPVPNYADFAVGVPTYADVRWAPIPNIRYTEGAEWAVHRAASRNNPAPQYRQLAIDVSGAAYFQGSAFSDGDRYIEDVASGSDGPGNPMTFLRAATSHHIAHVLDRLATLGGP